MAAVRKGPASGADRAILWTGAMAVCARQGRGARDNSRSRFTKLRERRTWKILPQPLSRRNLIRQHVPTAAARQSRPRPSANPRRLPRREGHVRDAKYPCDRGGTIVRINSRTATIDPGDGTQWRGLRLAAPRPDV